MLEVVTNAPVSGGVPLSTFIAAIGGLCGLIAAAWYVLDIRRGRKSQALLETEQLAETRGDRIGDLTAQIDGLNDQLDKARGRIAELEARLDTFSAEVEQERMKLLNDFADARHMLVRGVRELLSGILSDLQASPPDVSNAVKRISVWIDTNKPRA